MFKGIGTGCRPIDRAAGPQIKNRYPAWGVRFALLVAMALTGCASMRQGDQIFLQQNRASTALTQALLVAEAENPDTLDLLYDNEAALNEACAALQEVAYRRMQEEPVAPWLKFAAFGDLEGCATQSRAIEELLWEIDPETATHYLDPPLVSAMAEQ